MYLAISQFLITFAKSIIENTNLEIHFERGCTLFNNRTMSPAGDQALSCLQRYVEEPSYMNERRMKSKHEDKAHIGRKDCRQTYS